MNLKKIIAGISAVAVMFAFTTIAYAATAYSLFGDAAIVPGGNPGNAAQLRSSEPGGFGGVDFDTDTVSTLSDLQNLATDYNFTENSCGGGSPRFQVNVTDGVDSGNIFVYIGPSPNYTECPMNIWVNTGNLVTPASLVDTSQLSGGMFYDPFADALVKYGDYTVTGIQLVADGEWIFAGNQTVLADNVQINNDVVTFDPVIVGPPANKDECKDGGWMTFDNPTFKNQGDCVSYVQSNSNATGNKNK